ncbi:MAG: hypothetical protein DRH57_08760 [Candidatus Cloacimonadota bacterium]|nr:MAG: hypothetical protein DRH57_08760 [Candidatus Cloacimonadota bacterium]
MSKARYYIYRNLHKNMFSIKYKQKVIDRNNFQVMKDVIFVISKKGQDRVRLEKRKNVHATVSGFLVDSDDIDMTKYDLVELYYNPYTTDNFIIKETGKAITKTDYVLAKDNRIFDMRLKENI